MRIMCIVLQWYFHSNAINKKLNPITFLSFGKCYNILMTNYHFIFKIKQFLTNIDTLLKIYLKLIKFLVTILRLHCFFT